MKIILAFALLLIFSSCVIESKRESETAPAPLVDAKYSLTKDRAELDQLRESIPPEVKRQNDEKALMAEWMGSFRYSPDVIRDKWSDLVRKKRELFNKDMTKAREQFSKAEKKDREEFLKNLADEREAFLRRKVDREKRADFFNDQDEARRTFMAEQREKRDDFEADVRDKRKNFDDYIKEKTDTYNADFRLYQVKWNEKQKEQQQEQQQETENNGN